MKKDFFYKNRELIQTLILIFPIIFIILMIVYIFGFSVIKKNNLDLDKTKIEKSADKEN